MDEQQDSREPGRSAVSTRVAEIVVALILLALGGVVVLDSIRLGARWGEDGPQAGYFPFYIGLLICVASVVNLVVAARGRSSRLRSAFVEWSQVKRVFAVLLPALLYVLAIELIGIYIASAIYIAVFMKWLGRYPWYKGLAVGLGVSVAFYLMFSVWFKVLLPRGTFDLLSFVGL